MRKIGLEGMVLLLLAVAAVQARGAGGDANGASTALTIYSGAAPGAVPADSYRARAGGGVYAGANIPGYAVVRQRREITLEHRHARVKVPGVAALIDPSTVSFLSLSDPDTRVLDQTYQFDLASGAALLQRYLGHTITVEQRRGDKMVAVTGTLLRAGNGLILRDQQGHLQWLRTYDNVRFPELPGGVVTRPTLVWNLRTDRPGKQRVQVSYQTGGMTWWSNYHLTYRQARAGGQCRLDVGAWVSIVNRSGAGYRDARLKLIAGDVHRVGAENGVRAVAAKALAAAPAPTGFAQKPFSGYHLYTLSRRIDLPANSTRQIELFPVVRGVPCSRTLVYTGQTTRVYGSYAGPVTQPNFGVRSTHTVDIYLAFRNDRKSGLGIPLPAGRVRVSKQDAADNGMEFIGEDVIDHTPTGEKVRIRMGSAFDVVGERKQLSFHVDTKDRMMEEQIEIQLRNHKDQPIDVQVREGLNRWTNWKIVRSSQSYRKLDAHTIGFRVHVAKDGQATVRYTVRYTW